MGLQGLRETEKGRNSGQNRVWGGRWKMNTCAAGPCSGKRLCSLSTRPSPNRDEVAPVRIIHSLIHSFM